MILIFISDAMAHRPHAFGLTGEVQRKVRKVTKLQPSVEKILYRLRFQDSVT